MVHLSSAILTSNQILLTTIRLQTEEEIQFIMNSQKLTRNQTIIYLKERMWRTPTEEVIDGNIVIRTPTLAEVNQVFDKIGITTA